MSMGMDVEKTMAFLLEGHARFDAAMDRLTRYQIEAEERHDRDTAAAKAEMAEIRAELRRAIHAGVEEARPERQRRREMHEELTASIADLRAAQEVTEQKLQRLIDHLDRRA